MQYSFNDRLSFSRGIRERTDIETLSAMIDGCRLVEKSDTKTDKQGIDYLAYLRKGAVIGIDAKAREKGCSKYWMNHEPQMALEKYSVRPSGRFNTQPDRVKVGWTLCETKNVDLILFTFDPSDSNEVFLVGFQHLLMAFRRYINDWYKSFKVGVQETPEGCYESECVFVPAWCVLHAIREISQGDGRKLIPQVRSKELQQQMFDRS